MHQQVFGSPPSPNRAATSSQRSGVSGTISSGASSGSVMPPFWTVDPTGPVIIAAMDDRLAWLRAATAPPRRSIVELIQGGVLDAELAALAWVLLEARLPLIVAGLAQGAGKTTVFEALLDFLPLDRAADRPGGGRRGLRLAAGGRDARLAGGGGAGPRTARHRRSR